MVRGEAGARWMVSEPGEAERLRVVDEQPEHPEARRQRPDPALRLDVETHDDELSERRPLLVEHAQRAVARRGDRAGLVDDAMEQGGEVEVGLEEERRLEHPPELDGILDPPVCRDAALRVPIIGVVHRPRWHHWLG